MPSPKQFLQELKSRNVRKTMTIYLSSALTTIGVVKLFTEVYALPDGLFKVIVVLLTCGAASAFVVARYHGGEGKQKPQKKEFALHTLVLIAAIVLSLRVTGMQKTILRMPDDRTIDTDRLLTQSLAALKKYTEDWSEDISLPYDHARVLAMQGRTREACQLLSQAFDAGWHHYRLAAKDPVLGSLRKNPEFTQIIERMKASVDEGRRIAREAREPLP